MTIGATNHFNIKSDSKQGDEEKGASGVMSMVNILQKLILSNCALIGKPEFRLKASETRTLMTVSIGNGLAGGENVALSVFV